MPTNGQHRTYDEQRNHAIGVGRFYSGLMAGQVFGGRIEGKLIGPPFLAVSNRLSANDDAAVVDALQHYAHRLVHPVVFDALKLHELARYHPILFSRVGGVTERRAMEETMGYLRHGEGIVAVSDNPEDALTLSEIVGCGYSSLGGQALPVVPIQVKDSDGGGLVNRLSGIHAESMNVGTPIPYDDPSAMTQTQFAGLIADLNSEHPE